jgi:Domain of unknown function (DUF4326)
MSDSTSEPVRVQRKRTPGWRMPEGTVYVGRGTPWGNPFRVGTAQYPTVRDSLAAFEALMSEAPKALFERLRGKNLACWCPLDQPCHADVLLRLANDVTARMTAARRRPA